jgi:hypothetical protein
VIDLDDTYQRLAHPWSHEQLAARYEDAEHRGDGLLGTAREAQQEELTRPLALLATAIPPSATLSVAIHMLHALPEAARGSLAQQLVDTTEKNAADALHRCHRALELDGDARDYTADEWLPLIYDTAAPLLESARLTEEPPTVVRQAQEAISWLSRAVLELDQDSAESPTAIAEALARLLTVWVFADLARQQPDLDDR